MPRVTLPTVVPEANTGVFVCPTCGARCATFPEYQRHYMVAHVPAPLGRP